jgi:hypothetical protein
MAPSNPKRAKMSPSTNHKRAVRIAGCSGGFTDRSMAITRMAGDAEVDVVMGNIVALSVSPILRADSSRRLVVRDDHDRSWKR